MNNYSISYMFNVAVKHWISLVLAGIIAAIAAFSYFNFIAEPKYSAKGAIIVTNGAIMDDNKYQNSNVGGTVGYQDVLASLNFVDTVKDMLKTSKIYKELSDDIGGKYEFDELMKRTTVNRRDSDSLFVDVEFVDTNPKDAVKILNKYLELAPEYIKGTFVYATATVAPADKATWAYPNDLIVIALAGICGAALAYVVIFFIYSSSNVIRDEESFREHFDISIIGLVPDFAATKTHQKKYGSYYGAGGNKNGK